MLKINYLKEFFGSSYKDKSENYKWGDVEPFFNKVKGPKFFERSKVSFQSVSFSVIKEKPLFSILEHFMNILPQGAYIAGGFMRAVLAGEKEINGDIDFFFNSAKAFSEMVQILKSFNKDDDTVLGGYICETDLDDFRKNSSSYRFLNFKSPGKPDIQLIKLIWFDGPEHVIDSFDLTVVQLITDGTRLYYNPQALRDIEEKRLRLHRSQAAIVTLNRLLKYEKKGYYAKPREFADVANEAALMILNAKQDELQEYFYLPKSEEDRKLPAKWLNHAWKYLVESENGRMIFAKVFGSKERVEEDLKKIEKKNLDKPAATNYY